MLETSELEGLRLFRLARSLGGRSLYFTGAFWVDGLLIDTGASHTRDELLTGLGGLPVNQVVITHAHEDHIGGNGAVGTKIPGAGHGARAGTSCFGRSPETSSVEALPASAVGIPRPVAGSAGAGADPDRVVIGLTFWPPRGIPRIISAFLKPAGAGPSPATCTSAGRTGS